MSEPAEMPDMPPESPEIEAVTISGAEHLADFRAPELDATGGGEDDVISVDEDGAPIGDDFDGPAVVEMMSKDAFFTVLRHAFGLPGMFMPDFRPLAIQPQEESIARDASDAIYELLEIYYPNALMPQGDTFARIMTAAPFVMAKVLVVREILKNRKQAKLEEQRPARPAANTNAAPAEFSSSRTEPEPPQTEGGRYVAPLNEMAGLDQA